MTIDREVIKSLGTRNGFAATQLSLNTPLMTVTEGGSKRIGRVWGRYAVECQD